MQFKFNVLAFWAFYLIKLIFPAFSQEFIGCGGFVKSDIEINYSRIQVKVYNKQGALKYHTDCAPNNGYFMIPIYDKGEFVLKIEPPEGWTFEPRDVKLNIDGKTDVCSRGEDINFKFMGFAVEGKVISKGQSVGPKDLVVSMAMKGGQVKPLTTATDNTGKFKFPMILPGEYIVTATHPVWKFEKHSTTITVDKDTVVLSDALIIAGYDVRGQVSSEGEMVPNVKFVLLSDTMKPQDVSDCQKKAPAGFQNSGSKTFLCHVQSDASGLFIFPSMPTGKYSVVPFYRSDLTTFDLTPANLDITVGHSSLKLSTPFKIEGFSVIGRVVNSVKGKGIAGVTVTVNKQTPTTTKADGSFRLEKMKSGHYMISAVKEHYHFNELTTKITANTPELADIVAARFDLCGHLQIDQWPSGLAKRSHKVVVAGKDIKPMSKTVDKEGKFCLDVAPGTYTVKVEISDAEHAAGFQLVEATREVIISNSPVLDVNFQQFKAVIQGFVYCLDICGEVDLALKSVDHPKLPVRIIKLAQGTNRASFIIRDILPGTYTLNGNHAHWCWKEAVTIKVSNSDINDIKIYQSGYKLQCQSSHACSLHYQHVQNGKNSGKFDVVKGRNTICVDKAGAYKLTTTSCHQFDKKEYQFDTSNQALVSMTALKHLVQGKIISKEMISDIEVKITSSIPSEQPVTLGPLKAKASLTEKQEKLSGKDAKTTDKGKKESYEYEFSHWARTAEKLTFKPISGEVLFYPKVSEVKVKGDSCPGEEVVIEARTGIFISGKIVPPLEGVKIDIHTEAPDKAVDVIKTRTDNKGVYRVGPFVDTNKYTVFAEKQGYTLTAEKDNPSNFIAFKLGEITIQVVDENDQPLVGVVLSLSGGSFRSNQMTPQSGRITIEFLGSGQYFLRAFLKEYEFEPNSKMIEVKEASSVNLKVIGHRVAFSCYGSVTSLNGEPESNIALEAKGLGDCQQLIESATSDDEGKFRMRGLEPSCEYELRLETKTGIEADDQIERAVPPLTLLKPDGKDIHDVHIIVFRKQSNFDIGGNVVTDHQFVNTLKVTVFNENDLGSAIHTVALGASSFFHLPPLPMNGQKYVLRLESSLSKSNYKYKTQEASFIAEGVYQHITFEFNPEKRNLDQDFSQGSYFALPFIIALIVIGVNHSKVLPFLKQLQESIQKRKPSPVRADSREIIDDARQKKKTKPRKT
ncbi:BOS complex subunit NOMO1-like [Antedon mediterranea]|uniref:BOS complex subunit NOMO1-like n=1 Tax=Antedon mediterranea TaxID=105859 RepID=UPI003AF70E06